MLRPEPLLADLFDLAAEESLLGNLIVDPSAVEAAAGIICGADFGSPEYGRLFDSLVSLSRAGIPISDPVVLVGELRRMRLPDAVTGAAFVAKIIHCGVRFHERFYSTRIKELAHRRRLILIADRLRSQAADVNVDIAELQRRARATFDAIGADQSSAVVSLGEAAAGVVDELRKPRESKTGGAYFGLHQLDSMLGRMCPGELWVLAARPGNGKTSLGMQIATSNARKGRRVLVISLEMTSAELATRELCGEAGIDSRTVRGGDLADHDLQAIQNAAQSLQGLPVDIWSPPSSDAAGVRATALVSAARGDLALVVVDYISRMTSNARTSWERIAEQSGALKSMAKEIGAPVLCLSQFNRDADGERPSLAMLRYGGSIEQDADGVIALHPEDRPDDDDGDPFEIIVLKNRHGATGTINARFDRVATRFTDAPVRYAAFDAFNR